MNTTGLKLATAVALVLAMSACSQEKVCAMGAKAAANNTANLAKLQADVDANPTDANRKLLEKAKENQAKLEANLKAANCPATADAAAAPADTAGQAPATAAAPTVLGEGTFAATDGKQIKAVYHSDETVILTMADGSTKTLKQAVSGSGIRYTDGDWEWTEHQGEGRLAQAGKDVFVGKDQSRK